MHKKWESPIKIAARLTKCYPVNAGGRSPWSATLENASWLAMVLAQRRDEETTQDRTPGEWILYISPPFPSHTPPPFFMPYPLSMSPHFPSLVYCGVFTGEKVTGLFLLILLSPS